MSFEKEKERLEKEKDELTKIIDAAQESKFKIEKLLDEIDNQEFREMEKRFS